VSGKLLVAIHNPPKEDDWFTAAAFSARGEILATRTKKTILFWEVATGKRLWVLPGREDGVDGGFSSDGRAFVSWGSDQKIRLWRAADGKLLREHSLQGNLDFPRMAISPAKKILAEPLDALTIGLWNLETGECFQKLRGASQTVEWLRFSPQGKALIAVGKDERTLSLWEIATGKQRSLHSPEPIHVYSLVFSADEKNLAGFREDHRNLYLWDLNKENGFTSVRTETAIPFVFPAADDFIHSRDFAFSPDSCLIAVLEDRAVRLWDLATTRPIASLSREWGCHPPLAFSRDSKILITRVWDALHFWNWAAGQILPVAVGHSSAVTHLVFSGDGQKVVSGATDGRVFVWETETGKPLRQFPGLNAEVSILAVSADGRLVAAGFAPLGEIHVWEVVTGRERCRIKADCFELRFSPDGKTLVGLGREDELHIWDPCTGQECKQFKRIKRLFALPFDHDDWLCGEALELVHQTTSEAWLIFSDRGNGFHLAPNEKLVAFGGDSAVRLWEVVTGKEVLQCLVPGEVRAVIMTPKGQALALTQESASPHWVDVWDVTAGKRLVRILWDRTPVYTFAFSPDGGRLAIATENSTVLIWDLQSQKPNAGRPHPHLGPTELNRLWNNLAGQDAVPAFQAIQSLSAAPKEAVEFLDEQLEPVSFQPYLQLLRDLDDDRFTIRRAASQELSRLDYKAEPALRCALQRSPSLEVRRRVENLIDRLAGNPPTPEMLRHLRAIQVLEQIGTPEARRILESLGKGARDSRISQQTQAAQTRLAHR
jgi:WD40 repeat protein